MKATVSLLIIVTSLGHVLAQTYHVNAMRSAEAMKVASRLSVGMKEEEAEGFMGTNGLKAAYCLTASNANDSFHVYLLTPANHSLTLHFSMSAEKTSTNRVLTTAWLSRGTDFWPGYRIGLAKAPEATNPPTKALGRFGSIDRLGIQELRDLLQHGERIAVGDTLAISVVSDPAVSPGGPDWNLDVPAQRVQVDGCIALSDGAKVHVAGLRLADAASRIKGYYVVSFTGVFPKVTVTQVQHGAPP